MIDDPLIHYVLMRTDLPDYLPGKSMAQANHAGTLMLFDGSQRSADRQFNLDLPLWFEEGNGFGTCVVLGVTYREMRRAIDTAKLMNAPAGIVHDPSYPVRDGDRLQHLPVDTCAYLFGRKSFLEPIVGHFHLFRDPK